MHPSETFFKTLFGESLPDGAHILIWTLPDKRSHWCDSIPAAVEQAHRLREGYDVYFGLGLSGADYGPQRRCNAEQVIAIPGVWLDIDIADGTAHKKKNLPPDRQSVISLLNQAGLPPTMAVDSGHGLHVYWAFNEPFFIQSDEDRARACTLARRWNNTMRQLARSRGWDIDSTFDLARVFRVPGTTNRKNPKDERPVTIIHHAPIQRYTPDMIEARFQDNDERHSLYEKGTRQYGTIELDEFTLDPNAKVDPDMHEMMLEADDKYKASWQRTRKDMDDSASGYDLSLATIVARACWPDQEIVNLLIHSRRKHGDDLKLRPDYYRRTLLLAKQAMAKEKAIETLEELNVNGGVSYDAEGEAAEDVDGDHFAGVHDVPDTKRARAAAQDTSGRVEGREKALKAVSDLLNIPITRLIKYNTSPPSYRLECANGSIFLDNVNGLIKQDLFRSTIASLMNVLITSFKSKQWDVIAQALLNACEEQDTGDEATEEGELYSWLSIYLEENPASPEMSESVLACLSPFWSARRGRICVFNLGVRDWLTKKYGTRQTSKRFSTLMRGMGAYPDQEFVKIGEKGTTRQVWVLPPAFNQFAEFDLS